MKLKIDMLISNIDIICLVRQRTSSLIIDFEQVKKSFLVWNISFTFFLPVADCTILLSTEA